MELNECIPNVTRVRTPSGWSGTVIRVSQKLGVLVRIDHGGGAWSYRPHELVKVEPDTATMPVQVVP